MSQIATFFIKNKKILLPVSIVLGIIFLIYLILSLIPKSNDVSNKNTSLPEVTSFPSPENSFNFVADKQKQALDIKKKLNFSLDVLNTNKANTVVAPYFEYRNLSEAEIKEKVNASKIDKISENSYRLLFYSSRTNYAQDFVNYLNSTFASETYKFTTRLISSNYINHNEVGLSNPTKEGELINVYTYRIYLNNNLVTNTGGGVTITIEEDAYTKKTFVYIPSFFPKGNVFQSIVQAKTNGEYNIFVPESDEFNSLRLNEIDTLITINDFEKISDDTLIYIVTEKSLIPFVGKTGYLKTSVFPTLENRLFYFVSYN